MVNATGAPFLVTWSLPFASLNSIATLQVYLPDFRFVKILKAVFDFYSRAACNFFNAATLAFLLDENDLALPAASRALIRRASLLESHN